MYIMCVCLFSPLSRRVGTLQMSIIIININRKLEANIYLPLVLCGSHSNSSLFLCCCPICGLWL